jgi:hypothetical protein
MAKAVIPLPARSAHISHEYPENKTLIWLVPDLVCLLTHLSNRLERLQAWLRGLAP